MNFVKIEKGRLFFLFSGKEMRLFQEILKLYPLLSVSHQPISKAADQEKAEAEQKLLEEALAEQKKENKQQIEALINEPGRFKEDPSGFELSINRIEAEALLQALNDVRLGSWVILGEPDPKTGKGANLTEENARYVWIMEICGYFQALLLEALGSESPPG